jgi:hypothetical protein
MTTSIQPNPALPSSKPRMQFAGNTSGKEGYLDNLRDLLTQPPTKDEKNFKYPLLDYSGGSSWHDQPHFQGVPKFQGNGKFVRFRSLNVLA